MQSSMMILILKAGKSMTLKATYQGESCSANLSRVIQAPAHAIKLYATTNSPIGKKPLNHEQKNDRSTAALATVQALRYRWLFYIFLTLYRKLLW